MIRLTCSKGLLAAAIFTVTAAAGSAPALKPKENTAPPQATAAPQQMPTPTEDHVSRRSQQRREDARRERAAEIESSSTVVATVSVVIYVAASLLGLAAISIGIWRVVYVLRRRRDVRTLREILARKRSDLTAQGSALEKDIDAELQASTVPESRDVLKRLQKRSHAIVAAGEESLDLAEKRIQEDCVTADDREPQLLEVLELQALRQQLRLHQLAAPAGAQRATEQVAAVQALLASIEAGLVAARVAGLEVDSSALDMTRAQIAALAAEAKSPDPRPEYIATGCARVTRLLTAVHELISEAREQQLHHPGKG